MRLPVVTRGSFCFRLLQATSSPLLNYSSSFYLLISPGTPLAYLISDEKHFILDNTFGSFYFLVSLPLKSDSCEVFHKANILCCFIGWQYSVYILKLAHVVPSGITILNEENCLLLLNHQPLLAKVSLINTYCVNYIILSWIH